jgi:hypothetical protein
LAEVTRLKLEHQAALDAGAAHARAHHSAPPLSPQVTRLKLEHQAALNARAAALEDALAAALHARPMDDAQLAVLAAAMQQLGGGADALRHSASGAELPNLASRESDAFEQAGRQRTGRAHSATAELRKRRPWTELLTIRAPTTSANQPVTSAGAPTVPTPSDAMPCATSSSAASAIGLRRSSSSSSSSSSRSRTPEAEEEETTVTAHEGAAVGLTNDLAVVESALHACAHHGAPIDLAVARSRSKSSSSSSSSRDAGAGGDRSSSSDDDGGHQEGAHLSDLAPTPRGTSSSDTAQAPVPRRSTRSIGIQATSEIATSEIRGGAVGPLDARVITLAAGKVDIAFHPSAARALRGVSTWGTRVNPCQPCSRGAQAPLRTAVVEHQGQRLQLSATGTHTLSAPGCVLRIHMQ